MHPEDNNQPESPAVHAPIDLTWQTVGLWFTISFAGHLIGFFSGCCTIESGVEVLNLLFGSIGFVYKSSEEIECLCMYRLATVMFSVPSTSESESELLLSLLSEGEL